MIKFRHGLTSSLFAAALVAVSPHAYSLTAGELQAKLESDIAVPFSIGFVGPLKNASISVEGSGPFAVTISDATIDGSAIPEITFVVVDEGEVYKIQNAAVAGEISVNLSGHATITVSDLGWSGTWDVAENDFTEFAFSTSGIGVQAADLPIGFKTGEISVSTDLVDGTNKIKSVSSMNNFAVQADMTTIDPEMGSVSYSIGSVNSTTTVESDVAQPLWKIWRTIAGAALNAPASVADADERKDLLLGLVELMFKPASNLTIDTEMSDYTQKQGSSEFTFEASMASSKSTSASSEDTNPGAYKMVGSGEMEDYSVVLSSDQPMMNAEMDLKQLTTSSSVDNIEPAKLKAALIEMIETGNDNPENISISAVLDALYAFGGMSVSYEGTSFIVNHAMMGPVFSADGMGVSLDLNAQRDDHRYSGEAISLSGLSVPAVALANLPARVVPENISISFGLNHAPLPYYTDVIGRDNIEAMIKEEVRPDEVIFSNLTEILDGFNAGTFGPEVKIALSGEGYDFEVDAKFEVDAAFDPASGPAPDVKGTVTIKGLDGLKAFITGLSPDLSEDMQAGVFGAIGALGMAEGFAQRDEDGNLVYNIVMDSMNEVKINDLPIPLPN